MLKSRASIAGIVLPLVLDHGIIDAYKGAIKSSIKNKCGGDGLKKYFTDNSAKIIPAENFANLMDAFYF
jgi:hypothetical protein